MQPIQAILLGVIQGLTEFLPVSSSGHLVLLQNLLGLKEPEVLFDISLHIGTLTAVCVVFFSEIRSILKALLSLPKLIESAGGIKPLYRDSEPVRMAALIVAGSIPTALLGLMFHKVVDQLFGSVRIVGFMLIITGVLLWLTRLYKINGRPLKGTTVKDALIIGLVQGIAIMPGISRSGSTISTAIFMGVGREVSGRYSFLLSIPAILGALLLSLDTPSLQTPISGSMFLLGTASAGFVGFAALKVLLNLVNRGRLHLFSPYCWILGLTALILGR